MNHAHARDHDTPHPRTPLIGREREVGAVCALLARDNVVLVTLTGPGGVGKTRVALRVASVMRERGADGVVFVDLSPITDPALVLPAIARAFGVKDTAGPQLLDALVRVLAQREVLLVLDNVEQVIDAAVDVAALLTRCPGLTVLATSRERLHLDGEHGYPLTSLSMPGDAHRHSLAELSQFPAIQLFVESAQAADPNFALTTANVAAITDICRRLDGLPLAIELTAARSKVLPPAAMQARFESRLPLLSGGNREHPERQQTMTRTITWSYDLLTPEEQRFFRTLVVFTGGITLEAAEAVTTALRGEDTDTLSGIASLIDKSLLHVVDGTDDAPRYAMLETIREFGCDQLAASEEERSAREAHADWCLSMARNAANCFAPVTQLDVIDLLETEHANLRAALTWLAGANRTEGLLALAGSLGWFWYLGGHEREGLTWLRLALATPPGHTDTIHVEALFRAGQLAERLQEPDAANLLEQALALAHALGDRAHEAGATQLLGILAEDTGDYADAASRFIAARTMHELLGERWDVAVVEYHLGIVAYGQGDFPSAIDHLEAARTAAQAMGDALVPNWCLAYLTLVAAAQGQPARAAVTLRQLRHANAQSTMLPRLLDHHPLTLGLSSVVAARSGAWASTARLLGVVAADDRAAVIAMPEAAAFQRAEAEARNQMGDDAFQAAWNAGQDFHPDEINAEIEQVLAAAELATLPERADTASSLLTAREQDVLRLVIEGKSNREIADQLFISPRTATTHVTNILAKFGVETRAAAVAYAFQHHLV